MSDSISARASFRCVTPAAIRRSTAARATPVSPLHAPSSKEALADATAASTSAVPAAGSLATTSSVAASITSTVPSAIFGARQAPPMKSGVSRGTPDAITQYG